MKDESTPRDRPAVLVFGAETRVGAAIVAALARAGTGIWPIEWADSEADYDRLEGDLFERHIHLQHLVTVSQEAPVVASAGMTLGAWRSTELHLRRVFLASRFAVQSFLDGGVGGAIVHVAAGVDLRDVASAARLSALQSFTRSLTREYGRRSIRANLVWGAAPLTGDDFIDPALYFLSPESSFVNGEILRVGAPE